MVISDRKNDFNSAKLTDKLHKYKSAAALNNLAQRLSFYWRLPLRRTSKQNNNK